MYNIPNEISSETKIFKSIYVTDLLIILLALFFAWITSSIVYPTLILAYYIYTLVVAIFLVAKSPINPGMRNFMSIYLLITRDRKTYHSIDWDE
ncbi:TPA: DUF5592 family protein [Clostridioides difficile]|uniref:DUF5592 family protein n=1 Tax=Clostridioides TaxID=1870884 RepID=UPI00038D971A|nr:DUF5592 family protein [Clostridioides difficile]MCC0699453.1 hypothetical protein [Clostridioides sp. ZZV15-6383]EGT3815279.1 hypothetical protein [Clostridioides difficile]EGT4202986.1 hypothetical protein [Clostridioides difficile]EJX3465491.1 hypothetical protein [Clostridioides difficile]ELX4570428.1 hypothetical protein [Clostridioides difficile]